MTTAELTRIGSLLEEALRLLDEGGLPIAAIHVNQALELVTARMAAPDRS